MLNFIVDFNRGSSFGVGVWVWGMEERVDGGARLAEVW